MGAGIDLYAKLFSLAILLRDFGWEVGSLAMSVVWTKVPGGALVSMRARGPGEIPSFQIFLCGPQVTSVPLVIMRTIHGLQ